MLLSLRCFTADYTFRSPARFLPVKVVWLMNHFRFRGGIRGPEEFRAAERNERFISMRSMEAEKHAAPLNLSSQRDYIDLSRISIW
jgi:hypothetical protein